MRILVCLLSVLLLWVIGQVGEGLLNLFECSVVRMDAELPGPTALVVKYYPINSGHFVLSLTPARSSITWATR